MRNFCFAHSGGLGDIMWPYVTTYYHLLEELKRLEPNSHVTYLVCSDNNQVKDFYQTNPYVNTIIHLPMSAYHNMSWKNKLQNKIDIVEHIKLPTLPPPAKKFWLNPEERSFASNFMSKGKFIALHSSGGTPDRSMHRGNFSLKTLVDVIMELGFNCILLGGSSDTRYKMNQPFSCPKPQFTDLRNRFTCRLHAHLTAHANAFIGVSSCYSPIAARFNVPSLIYYPSSLRWWQQGTPPQVGVDILSQAFRDNNNWAEFFEDPSTDTHSLISKFITHFGV
jgi:hypothetical protein